MVNCFVLYSEDIIYVIASSSSSSVFLSSSSSSFRIPGSGNCIWRSIIGEAHVVFNKIPKNNKKQIVPLVQ
ncbi:hypothetical protein RIF29_21048 [Crotalaria pallida]|uniref:Uncharacterized protein n=1 Tax=Crotalaria pallida TaxID=3830 RepID=A0AAN9F6Q2_CROPI